MAELIPAALYWLKILVSLGLFWVFFQLTQTSKREGNLCHFLISRILCLVEPTAPPDPPRQQVPRVFLTSSNGSAIRAASLFHFPFVFISKAQQPRGLRATVHPETTLGTGKEARRGRGGEAGRNPSTTGRHGGCLLWTEVQYTIWLYGPGFKELSGFDRKTWRAIAEELSEAAGVSIRDPGPHHGNCWLCESHPRHGSRVMVALLPGRDVLQEPGVISAFPHKRRERARLCEQSTALLAAPNPSPTMVPASRLPTAKAPIQNHSCWLKKAGRGTQHVVVQDSLHVVPAVLAPTAVSSMHCNTLSSSCAGCSLKATLKGGNMMSLLPSPTVLDADASSTSSTTCRVQPFAAPLPGRVETSPAAGMQKLRWTNLSPKFWLCNGHSIRADPGDHAQPHRSLGNGIPLGGTKIPAGKMDFVARTGGSGLCRL